MHRHLLFAALTLLALLGCTSTAPTGNTAPPPTGDAPTGSRLDVFPEESDDELARIPVKGGIYQGVKFAEVATALAAQTKIPFQFYGEGIEESQVSVTIPGGSLRDATTALCRAAGCQFAYYINTIDRTVIGIKVTRQPYRSYGKGELGRLNVITGY